MDYEKAEAFERDLTSRIEKAMKHMLVVNDIYGKPVIRSAILDEMNELKRKFVEEFAVLCTNGSSPEPLNAPSA